MNDLSYAVLGPDPAATAVAALGLGNLAAGAAILAVVALRPATRRLAGPAAAYGLWRLPLLALAGALLVVLVPRDAESLSTAAALASHVPGLGYAVAAWLAGFAVMAGRIAVAQARFQAEVRAGRAGPAVVGLISPRIVMPADEADYTAEERDLIRAHERAHIARKDPRAAAVAAFFQCACWFNPLVHLAAFLVRLDQELACDAAVVMSRPHARSLYARTLLKTQLAATPLPLGCYWPARGQHPLEVRIGLLKPRPGQVQPRAEGGIVVAASIDAIRP
ncbi:MAG: peptidase M56 [Phenylobacterium zucineum]|nr:MAG: peptidase M56 [Phenylobacterium zucineum]